METKAKPRPGGAVSHVIVYAWRVLVPSARPLAAKAPPSSSMENHGSASPSAGQVNSETTERESVCPAAEL